MKQVLRNKDKGNRWIRVWKSFFHALDGILYAIRYEHNLITILLAIFVVTIAGIYFQISSNEWLFCIIMYGLVMGTELLNSSIEALTDLITMKEHPLAKIAKDTAAGATLIFSITSFVGACIIFIPKF